MIACASRRSGPVFGMKGGATGGGWPRWCRWKTSTCTSPATSTPSVLANNLLAALMDNHIHHGNALDIDVRRISWKRVVDMNDRALREITVGLGGPANGFRGRTASTSWWPPR
jgi:formate--tetrahydrofolate ligase